MEDKQRQPSGYSKIEINHLIYNQIKHYEMENFKIFADYGKWLVTTLTLIHSGGLFATFSLFSKESIISNSPVVFSIIWVLVGGLMLSLLCGLSAWSNWGLISSAYRDMANLDMLWDPEQWAAETRKGKWITVTMWLSVIFGIASAVCVPLAVHLARDGIVP